MCSSSASTLVDFCQLFLVLQAMMIHCVVVGKCIGGERLDRMCIKNLVLARYTVDDKVSRVKMNEVFDDKMYSVSLIDYGTNGDDFTTDYVNLRQCLQ